MSNAQAANYPIQIVLVFYNSPGSDNGSNSSLNSEYVTIKNTSSVARSMTGYTLRDRAGHVYTFGTFTLGAGKSVTVHTGKGTNSSTHKYWGREAYVWNNTGDTAYLRNAFGTLRDSCTWSGSSHSSTRC
ncbi:MAG: lamin tail domain-containing protein [Sporichthyaceae bacterium]|nr:lamin tail domain-containing protein [Sporichthyaceae bacterium]